MEYKKGTITKKKGTRFKDNGKEDPRPNGHPVLIPLASDDISMDTYYLMIDSHPEKYIMFGDAYYVLQEWEEVHLEMPSVINLKTIYKDHVCERILGGLPPRSYKAVIAAFKEYQSEHPDEYYEEIKDKL